MCGIAGGYFRNKVDQELMQQATDTMFHRGPDAGGYYTDANGKMFLGHRRLSIIDLSVSANQPMKSSCGRYMMVYNGEVYNFNELRSKLPGHKWNTHSDTEVILELFAHLGPGIFAWLNGIFALAIYDTAADKVWVCRDQLGIKPLFIRHDNEGVIFSSELKVITGFLKIAGISTPGINKKAVPYFLHLGYIPEPYTIYEGIEKFPAGHYASWDGKTHNWEIQPYWQASDHYLRNPVKDEKEALKLYREKLFGAIEKQMVSDVPLGTFLSGGIDSSLVTAVAANISKQKVKTFSIGFEDAAFDESEYAGKVADHLGTEHHLFKVKFDDILSLVPDFINVYDEPFADSSAFPTMLVSRLARQYVTVTLSGDGGDEFFQGYGMYNWAKRLSDPRVKALRKPIAFASSILNERYQRAGKLFNYPHSQRLPSHIFSQEQYLFSERELKRLLQKPDFDFTSLNHLPVGGKPAEQQAFWDIGLYLKDDLLVKVDRASMRYSLETRVPLLDMDIVEFALNLPIELKVREGFGTKYLMKKVLYDLVPRPIFERPKRGFSIPLNKWLKDELRPLVEKNLSEEAVNKMGVVSHKEVNALLKSYYGGKTFLYNRVWALLILHWWFAEHCNKYE